MDGLNIIERANKVITFRKYIREECRKKGLDYPSDEKLAEYINNENNYNVDTFMDMYIDKKGIFKDPMDDFKAELALIEWGEGEQPTDEEIAAYVAENGYNVHGFITHHVINTYKGFEKATLLATLKLDDVVLVTLWNTFIEESAKYGEDSYIYDLKHQNDVVFINDNFPKDKIAELTRIIRNERLHGNEVRFFQWYNLNDKSINVKHDIKGIIVAYWGEIFERIMIYPNLYELGEFDYFTNVFWGECMKHLGYKYDQTNGKLNPIEK
jgi:hypothetical protein